MDYREYVDSDILKAMEILEEIGLKHVSTKRQIQNGTLMFEDPQDIFNYLDYEDDLETVKTVEESRKYTIHKSGYARKRILGGFTGIEVNHYQLNPVLTKKTEWSTSVKRILFPDNYTKLAEIVKSVVIKSRNRK